MTHNTLFRSALRDWDIAHKRVIVRADLNIEDSNNNNMRLQALLPTLDLIRKKKGEIVLITHIGRPTQPTPSLSTQQLIPLFRHYNYDVTYIATPAQALVTHAPILLLENIRFFPEEKKGDMAFARVLAQMGAFYINDGFGVLHRSDCSVTQVPLLFPPNRRTFGLLVERELNILTPLQKHPEKPYIIIIGGAKIKEKIALIEHALTTASTIMLCPAIVFTFNKAQNKSVGTSLIDTSAISLCKQIIDKARAQHVNLLFPIDYQVSQVTVDSHHTQLPTERANELISHLTHAQSHAQSHAQFAYTQNDQIRAHEIGISVGPKTIRTWSPYIQEAKTIFFNGAMGFLKIPETRQTTNALLDILAAAPGKTIVAGGDSVAAVYQHGVQNSIDYLSTGGGSALAYLSNIPLPGLAVLF